MITLRLPEKAMKLCHSLLIAALSLVSCTEQSTQMTNEPTEFLAGYSGQTTDELIALASNYRIDSIVLAFEQALDQRSLARELTVEESLILAIEALEREVNNGGYLQFFENSSREYTATIVRALEAISCPQVAALTQRAIDSLEIDGEITEAAVEAAIEAREDDISESLDALDSEYFQLSESIGDRLFEFIKAHKLQIKAEA